MSILSESISIYGKILTHGASKMGNGSINNANTKKSSWWCFCELLWWRKKFEFLIDISIQPLHDSKAFKQTIFLSSLNYFVPTFNAILKRILKCIIKPCRFSRCVVVGFIYIQFQPFLSLTHWQLLEMFFYLQKNYKTGNISCNNGAVHRSNILTAHLQLLSRLYCRP